MCATASLAPAPVNGAASRASWSGQLELGPLKIPVKAYPALVVPSNGPLHSIHAGCGERLSQRKVCSKHGDLAAGEIGKAFQYGPNDQLTFSTEELDSLSPADDETIHIEHLLPLPKLEPALLSGRSLYLAPAHTAAESTYARALCVLTDQNTWAVGRMILSDQRRVVAVRAESRRLQLVVLHWPEHRRVYPATDVDVTQVPPVEIRALEKALLPLHKAFDWRDYRDEGTERLHQLIQAKVAQCQPAPAAAKTGRRKSPAAAPRVKQAA